MNNKLVDLSEINTPQLMAEIRERGGIICPRSIIGESEKCWWERTGNHPDYEMEDDLSESR